MRGIETKASLHACHGQPEILANFEMVALRDINDLLARGVLRKAAGGCSTRYELEGA